MLLDNTINEKEYGDVEINLIDEVKVCFFKKFLLNNVFLATNIRFF